MALLRIAKKTLSDEVFDQLYSEAAGYDVDPATMMDGQMLLRIAVNSVGILSQMPDKVEEAAAPFPWGRLHLLDLEVEGSPPCEGELVARYWRVLWALAHEQPLPGPVLGTRGRPGPVESLPPCQTFTSKRGGSSSASPTRAGSRNSLAWSPSSRVSRA